MNDSDKNYIIKTALNDYKSSWEARCIEKSHYFEHFNDIFLNLTDKAQILTKTDKNIIQAFIIYQENTLHYIYTINYLRNKKIASELLQKTGLSNTSDPINITFLTKDFKKFLNKQVKWIYTPFKRYV